MRQQLVRLSAAAVVATVTLSACSSSGNQAATKSPSTSPAQAHNSTDITFAQNMMPCHKQAIQMSDIILTKQGLDPRVVQVANQIKAAEGPDVQGMQSWLSQWQQPTTPMTPSSAAGMPAMQGMAGMMSPEQITALQNAQGADASKQFLTMMIQNHQHAVMLAQSEIDSGQYPPAVAMAHSIATGEQQEVNTMQGILG
ncbi:MAG: DUF305 domain-containing protein [Mycobacterium sp.]|uniref:DUF305 domain-containing protein n=1 Tax=Mycobacterium sp. TaxID=1785 RepID=UPI003BB009A5